MLETAAMMTGSVTGRKSNGSSSSRARVWTAIAEKSVPTAASPRHQGPAVWLGNRRFHR